MEEGEREEEEEKRKPRKTRVSKMKQTNKTPPTPHFFSHSRLGHQRVVDGKVQHQPLVVLNLRQRSRNGRGRAQSICAEKGDALLVVVSVHDGNIADRRR